MSGHIPCPVSARCCGGSSPRSCVGQEKAVWNFTSPFYTDDYEQGFSWKRWILGNMLNWNTACTRHTVMRWLYPICTFPPPSPPSKGKRILFEKYCEISKWKVGGYYLSCGVCWKKNWMEEQIKWEEMWKQWEEEKLLLALQRLSLLHESTRIIPHCTAFRQQLEYSLWVKD